MNDRSSCYAIQLISLQMDNGFIDRLENLRFLQLSYKLFDNTNAKRPTSWHVVFFCMHNLYSFGKDFCMSFVSRDALQGSL